MKSRLSNLYGRKPGVGRHIDSTNDNNNEDDDDNDNDDDDDDDNNNNNNNLVHAGSLFGI